MNSEIYSIDYSFKSSYFLYGGNDQQCTIFSTRSNTIVSIIEGFSESVIFCKLLSDNLILVCSIDGYILTTDLNNSFTSTTQINEEISCVHTTDNHFYIGTYTGTIYKIHYKEDINCQEVLMGHGTEILSIISDNNIIYTLSSLYFIKYINNNIEYKINLVDGVSFSIIPDTEIFCICTSSDILIYKKDKLIKKISSEYQPECVIYTEGYFVVGGYCDYLLLINTNMNMVTYKYSLVSSGVNKLISKLYKVYFSTTCGYVGSCDIRKDDTVEMYESKVGTVFDMCVNNDTFYIGGLNGVDILKTEEFK